jgi:probable F420-dependent oxidoreductase
VEIGAIFPQTEIGADLGAVREFAQAAEDLGYAHVLLYDHVVGANIERPDRAGGHWPYTHHDPFQEPFVALGYLAGVTQRVELVTGIVILPQRQTVLAAKQAATVDVLSGGRLRLGVGLGWNQVEYEVLGQDFHTRGKRLEEQVAVLRALWTQEIVTFHGRWHDIDEAGIKPLPVQRPIPLWMGGSAEPVLRRIGALADGWILAGGPSPDLAEKVAHLQQYARAAGRDPAELGIQGAIPLRSGGPDQWRQDLNTWQELGATHAAVNTMRAGLKSPSDHISALRRMKQELG